jgi:hypothetical protein
VQNAFADVVGGRGKIVDRLLSCCLSLRSGSKAVALEPSDGLRDLLANPALAKEVEEIVASCGGHTSGFPLRRPPLDGSAVSERCALCLLDLDTGT